MDLLLAWLLFPLLLTIVTGGLGLLVERVSGAAIPGTLLVPTGLAALIVVATLTTEWSTTAPATTPVVVALAGLGGALSLTRLRALRPEPATLLAALGVFGVCAAPVVFSGEPTFAGYTVLGDTAIQLIGIDRLLDHGRDLGGLPESSYRAALSAYFGSGYPFGAQVAIGSARPLTGLDAAWIYQPGLAFLMVALMLSLRQLAGTLLRSTTLAAVVAFLAAQPALLYAYGLQGSVKELATAALVALLAATLLPLARAVGRAPGSARAVVPLAFVVAASVAAIGLAAAVWVGPIVVAALLVCVRERPGTRALVSQAAAFAALLLVLSIPAVEQLGGYFRVTTGVVTAGEEVGNLIGPLNPLQSLGIWINGDYRLDPGGPWLWVTRLLLLVALVALLAGFAAAVARRAWALLLYGATALLGAAVVVVAGSPWAGGKALAILSPALLLFALLGAAAAVERALPRLPRRRLALVGGVALGALGAGVLLSNAFAYRDVRLAPHDRMEELREVGARAELRGPLLTTEFEEFAKHFLRDGAPFGVSEALSPRPADPAPPGRPGPRFGFPSDLDELSLPYVTAFHEIVMRRSPFASRPPAGYERVWSGRWYELWRRASDSPQVVQHLPLGDDRSAADVPRCEDVAALARAARQSGGRLAYAPRPLVPTLVPTDPGVRVTGNWGPDDAQPLFVSAVRDGTIEGTVEVERAGRYDVWLGGSFGGDFRVELDGREVGGIARELSGRGQYAEVAEGVELSAGRHTVRIVRAPRTLAPGATASTIGPLALAPAGTEDAVPVRTVAPRAWRSICGRPADWVELIAGS
jgi:hypothetical protein